MEPWEQEYEDLKSNFAEALWSWANIEADLFSLYQCAIGYKSEGRALHKAFFSIKGVEIRISVTDAAFINRWPTGEHAEKWKQLRANLDKSRRARGKLAHHAGIKIQYEPFVKPRPAPLVILVEPYTHEAFPEAKQDALNRGFTAAQLGALK